MGNKMAITEMSPAEQNIAIAYLCGWVRVGLPFERHGITLNGPVFGWYHPDVTGCSFNPPDYVNNLNDIAKAEQLILESSKPWSSDPLDHEPCRYLNELIKVTGADMRKETVVSGAKKPDGSYLLLEHYVYASYDEELKVIRATAAQRAEAILKTLDKWDENV
jgi:hypothetical protein